MKRIITVILLLILATTAFAESNISSTWAKSYYNDNDLNLYASLGYVYGLCVGLHGEWIISEFPIPECPLDFGLMVNVHYQMVSTASVTAHGIALAPTFAVHLGLKNVPIEFFVSLGVGLGMAFADDASAVGFYFATVEGFIWHITDMIGLFAEFSWIGDVAWGVGVQIML